MVWNREIVVLRAPFEQMSPADRAASVAPRILAIPENLPQYRVEAKKATVGDYKGAWIMVNGQTVFGLLTGDADLQAGETFDRPAASYVGQWLQSFHEYPPRQKPGSFNLDNVMEAVTSGSAGKQ